MKKILLVMINLIVFFNYAVFAGDLTLPIWVDDHMMLPADRPCRLQGRAAPGADITVTFAGKTKSVKTDDLGQWSVTLAPLSNDSGPCELIVSSSLGPVTETRKFTDVAVGDTWLCSGQSNMAFPVSKSDEADEVVADIRTVDIRYFDGKSWMVLDPSSVSNVSAVAVFFAIEMALRQNAPVGIFVAARGGTAIEAWVPVDTFPDTEAGRRKRLLAHDPEVLKAAEEDAADFRPWGQHRLYKWKLGRAVPASLYEKLIQPFGDLPIRGILWYQGESDAGSQEYDLWLSNLISSWRNHWNSPRLPFVIIQLPAFDKGTEDGRAGWAGIQNMQASVAKQTAFAGIVDIRDLGDLHDIHPRRKKEVGRRAADVMCELLKENE